MMNSSIKFRFRAPPAAGSSYCVWINWIWVFQNWSIGVCECFSLKTWFSLCDTYFLSDLSSQKSFFSLQFWISIGTDWIEIAFTSQDLKFWLRQRFVCFPTLCWFPVHRSRYRAPKSDSQLFFLFEKRAVSKKCSFLSWTGTKQQNQLLLFPE